MYSTAVPLDVVARAFRKAITSSLPKFECIYARELPIVLQKPFIDAAAWGTSRR